jgi:hypothetical protein
MYSRLRANETALRSRAIATAEWRPPRPLRYDPALPPPNETLMKRR